MTRYRPIQENSEVMDVLYCIALGHDKVKDIMKVLKQPQSTVSEKLRFLIKNKLVKKNKWEFEVDWKALLVLMRKAIEKELQWIDKRFLKLFDDERLKNIFITYSKLVIGFKATNNKTIKLGFKPESIRNMMQLYILGMSQEGHNEAKEFGVDMRLIEISRELGAESLEKFFFEKCEIKFPEKNKREVRGKAI